LELGRSRQGLGSRMKINRIEVTAIRLPSVSGDVADGAHDDVIVRVHTDEGIVGVGEVDAPPTVIKAIIEAPTSMLWAKGIQELLIGEDPLQPARLWHKVYEGTIYSGRRGLGIMALGAIDIALYDIAGKALGVPVYKLLGGVHGRPQYMVTGGLERDFVVPYASILPTGETTTTYHEDGLRKLSAAVDAGFRAAKMEILYADRDGDRSVLELIRASRKLVGDEVDLLVDVGYRWMDAKAAIPTVRAMEEYNVFALEAALHIDNLRGYAELSRASSVRLAVGEMLSTRFEFVDFMDRGLVDVVQPSAGRVGGLTEAMRVGQLAHDRGLLCIPMAWKSGISIAANLHLAAALPNTPYFEFMILADDVSDVRRRLATREFEIEDGRIQLPTEPGLGLEVNEEVLAAYAL
jgi:L-alanine-DL-glutamate epimerase-like enolase superfamily enzyme